MFCSRKKIFINADRVALDDFNPIQKLYTKTIAANSRYKDFFPGAKHNTFIYTQEFGTIHVLKVGISCGLDNMTVQSWKNIKARKKVGPNQCPKKEEQLGQQNDQCARSFEEQFDEKTDKYRRELMEKAFYHSNDEKWKNSLIERGSDMFRTTLKSFEVDKKE
jgi:hypothetical protein